MSKRVKVYPPKIEITETKPEKKPRINYRMTSPYTETGEPFKFPGSYRRLRGDLLRSIRRLVPEITGIEHLHISDLEDVRESIRRCDMLRIIAR